MPSRGEVHATSLRYPCIKLDKSMYVPIYKSMWQLWQIQQFERCGNVYYEKLYGQYINISWWSLCSIHLSRDDIRASAAQHHCISSHQCNREATEELAGGFSLFTPLLPCQSLPNAPHHASCHTVEAAKSLHCQGKELQPLGSASFGRVSHFPIIGFCKSLASFSCRACHIGWG